MDKNIQTKSSKLVFQVNQLCDRLIFKKMNFEESNRKFTEWQHATGFNRSDFRNGTCPFVFIVKYLSEEITETDQNNILDRVNYLLRDFQKDKTAYSFGFSSRSQVQPVYLLPHQYSGFKLSCQGRIKLKQRFDSAIQKLESENEAIDRLLNENDLTFNNSLITTHSICHSRILKKNITQDASRSHTKIKKLCQQIQILQAIEDYLQKESLTFPTIKQIHTYIQQNYDIAQFSRSSLYRLIKYRGFNFRSIIQRNNENGPNKLSRIRFYKYYTDLLIPSDIQCCYFDWTSFAENNFKKRIWAQRGDKPIVKSRYSYSNLHLFVLLGREKVFSFQFFKGRISSEIIFSFLSQSIIGIERFYGLQRNSLVVILDNSPLNQSLSLFNFMTIREIKLLFTAPSSSFLNPIEMLFAKVKQPLKSYMCLNKYSY